MQQLHKSISYNILSIGSFHQKIKTKKKVTGVMILCVLYHVYYHTLHFCFYIITTLSLAADPYMKTKTFSVIDASNFITI